MNEVMISLQAPVSRQKVQRWVEEQVDRLRDQGLASGVRLGRLATACPAQGGDWVVEVDRQARDARLEDDIALASILTDMALLGLRPRLLVNPLRERPALVHAEALTQMRAPRGDDYL